MYAASSPRVMGQQAVMPYACPLAAAESAEEGVRVVLQPDGARVLHPGCRVH